MGIRKKMLVGVFFLNTVYINVRWLLFFYCVPDNSANLYCKYSIFINVDVYNLCLVSLFSYIHYTWTCFIANFVNL